MKVPPVRPVRLTTSSFRTWTWALLSAALSGTSSTSPAQPRRIPSTRYPSCRARIVMARMAGFSPGTSPPPVNIPIVPLCAATPTILRDESPHEVYPSLAIHRGTVPLFATLNGPRSRGVPKRPGQATSVPSHLPASPTNGLSISSLARGCQAIRGFPEVKEQWSNRRVIARPDPRYTRCPFTPAW